VLLLAATPAIASKQGRFNDGHYVAPGAIFTAKSPLGPGARRLRELADFIVLRKF